MEKEPSLNDLKQIFFIGIAGVGMSSLAQYLRGLGKQVSGSDRQFSFSLSLDVKSQLQADGIECYPQDGTGLTPHLDLVVCSGIVQSSNPQVQKAKQLDIPFMLRHDLLLLITRTKRTIAVGGTSGKSSTVGMIYHTLERCGYSPSLISGGGLMSLVKLKKIGNCVVGGGEWLVVQADESDGSIVDYQPEIGVLLNVSKDHKEVDKLVELFERFRKNSKAFIVNHGDPNARQLSVDKTKDFGCYESECESVGYSGQHFEQKGFSISFKVKEAEFALDLIGKHNMQNALAAIATASYLSIPLDTISQSLKSFEGIYRRNQLIGIKNGIIVIDDYAHNPAKCCAIISSTQPLSNKVISWYQPHGFGPTRFCRKELIQSFNKALRGNDQIWMSEIYMAEGSQVQKSISSKDLVEELRVLGKKAYFVQKRTDLAGEIKGRIQSGCVLLLMGGRDPSLHQFAHSIYEQL